MKTLPLLGVRIGIVVSFLAAWEIVSISVPIADFAASRPSAIAVALFGLLRHGEIIPHLVATGSAALSGLVLGTLIGTGAGLATWFSRNVAGILQPFVVALGAIPILAIAPLMIIWFGIGLKMKVALACLSTVFIAFAQSEKGASGVSENYTDVMRGMGASNRQIFLNVIVPGSMDWVFSAMRLNAGLALLGTFIGEFIASDVGLGHLVLRASGLYDVPRAMAAALFIVALAILFDFLASKLERSRNVIIRFACVPRQAWDTFHE